MNRSSLGSDVPVEYRLTRRKVASGFDFMAPPEYEYALQGRFQWTDYEDGLPVRVDSEWRDMPTLDL